MSIQNLKLDHIGLAVTDVEKAMEWYVSVLGGKIEGKFRCDGNDYNVYFIRVGETLYEMYQDTLSPDVAGKIDHIAYTSEDLEADYKYCLEKGYTVCTNGIEGIPTFWENGCRYFKILSPTGEQVEIAQKC